MKKKYKSMILLMFLAAPNLWAQETVVFSEALIKDFISKNPPSIQQIEASFLMVKQNHLSNKDQFGFRLEAEGSVYESKERLLSGSDGGVTKNASSYSLGVVKPTAYGINVGLKAFGNKSSNAFIENAATSGMTVSLSIDLYKNFLGRKTNNNIKKTKFSLERAELEKKSQLKTFESNLRKIYWSLVANKEQKKLLSSLEKSAEKQYRESVSRKKSGVADSGEVARYRSQWTTRKANLLSLNYREGEILKSLRELIPELNGKKIVLDNYNVDKTITKVFICTAEIHKYKSAPLKNTNFDEIIELLNKEQNLDNKIVNAYDDPSINLVGEYSSTGRDFGLDNAQENFSDDPKARTSLGLKISIPIDRSKKRTRLAAEKLSKYKYEAQLRSQLSRINAFHSETVNMISTLKEVVRNQKETTKYLTKSLKISKRKYKQARISLQELISEQDSHLQSNLSQIDSQLVIINTLIDYLSIYSETPCELNRI